MFSMVSALKDLSLRYPCSKADSLRVAYFFGSLNLFYPTSPHFESHIVCRLDEP